jgi:glycosyltransferase involved in cell wall biosynthesis
LKDPLPAEPLICVCLATYNPEEDVLRRQIDSIRNQTYTNWICMVQDDWSSNRHYETIRKVIGDDPRFLLQRNEQGTHLHRPW